MDKCIKCETELTQKELCYYNANDNKQYFIKSFGGVYCSKHLCDCTTNINNTPWSWLIECNLCDKNHICKSCKYVLKGNINVCYDCHEKHI